MRNEQSKTTVGLSGRTAARSKEKFNWKNVAADTEGVYSSSAALNNLKQLKPTPSIATSHFAMTQAKIAASPPRRAKQWATSGLAVFGVNQARVTELNHDQIVGRQSEYAPRSLGKLLQKSERRIGGFDQG